jgi:hypothetical protein
MSMISQVSIDIPFRYPRTNSITQGSVFAASIGTFIEPNSAIISACLPFFGSLIGRKLPKKLGYGSKSFNRLHSGTNPQSRSGMNSKVGQHSKPVITKHSVTTVSSTNKWGGDDHELNSYTVLATSGGRVRPDSAQSLV